MANQHEEVAADLIAFEILRGVAVGQRYAFMARNLFLRKLRAKPGETREWEFDLIGFAVDRDGRLDYVDLFEFKLKRRPGVLLSQLRKRADLGIFRRIYGAWEDPGRASGKAGEFRAEGFGSLSFGLKGTHPYIGACTQAPPRPVGGGMADRFFPELRGLTASWVRHMKGQPTVYMTCHACRLETPGGQFFLPFTARVLNTHPPTGAAPTDHAWHCRVRNPQRRGMLSGVGAVDRVVGGEVVETTVFPGYFIMRDM
jgi:hypothetical protein